MSLWQKPEDDQSTRPSAPSRPATAPIPAGQERRSGAVNIGQSVRIKGELSGNEDLCIDGKIEGKIKLNDHHLVIGPNGHIAADVHAKTVQVNGSVTGNITADDKVEIAPSGSVEGDISAPRVALADGSSFKGSIDMAGNKKSAASAGSSPTATSSEMPLAAGPAKR